jgi:hypothetical protein
MAKHTEKAAKGVMTFFWQKKSTTRGAPKYTKKVLAQTKPGPTVRRTQTPMGSQMDSHDACREERGISPVIVRHQRTEGKVRLSYP